MRHLHCAGLLWKYIFVWLHCVSHPNFLCLLPTSNDHLPSAGKGRLGVSDHQWGKKNKAVLEHTYAQIVQPGVKCSCRMCPLYYYSTDTSISAVSITFSNTRHQAPPRRHQQLMRNPNYCYWTRGRTKIPLSANKESRQAFGWSFQTIHCGVGGMHMLDPHLFLLRQCRSSSRDVSLASSLLLLALRVCFTN